MSYNNNPEYHLNHPELAAQAILRQEANGSQGYEVRPNNNTDFDLIKYIQSLRRKGLNDVVSSFSQRDRQGDSQVHQSFNSGEGVNNSSIGLNRRDHLNQSNNPSAFDIPLAERSSSVNHNDAGFPGKKEESLTFDHTSASALNKVDISVGGVKDSLVPHADIIPPEVEDLISIKSTYVEGTNLDNSIIVNYILEGLLGEISTYKESANGKFERALWEDIIKSNPEKFQKFLAFLQKGGVLVGNSVEDKLRGFGETIPKSKKEDTEAVMGLISYVVENIDIVEPIFLSLKEQGLSIGFNITDITSTNLELLKNPEERKAYIILNTEGSKYRVSLMLNKGLIDISEYRKMSFSDKLLCLVGKTEEIDSLMPRRPTSPPKISREQAISNIGW